MDKTEDNFHALESFLAGKPSINPQMQKLVVDGHETRLGRIIDEAGEDQVLAYAPVGMLPAGDQGAFYRLLLIGNFLWFGTRGNTLGLFDDDDRVILSQSSAAAGLSPQGLDKILHDLVLDAREWRKLLDSLSASAGSQESRLADQKTAKE